MIMIMHAITIYVNDNHNADLFISRTHNVNQCMCTKFDVRRVLRLIVIHI